MRLKPGKAKTIWRWIKFLFLWGIVFSLWITDFHCSRYGVPQWVQNKTAQHLKEKGIGFRARQIYFSFIDGFFFSDLELEDQKTGAKAIFPSLYFKLEPTKIFQGILCPVNLTVNNASLMIPLAPESGDEGKMDRLFFHEISGEIRGYPGFLRVQRAKASAGNFSIRMEGTIDNLVHLSLERLLQNLISGFRQQESAEQNIPELDLPPKLRSDLFRFYDNLEHLRMEGTAHCGIRFHADLKEFKNCQIIADFSLPPFQYNNLTIKGFQEQLILKNGSFRVEQLSAELGDATVVTAEMNFNHTEKAVSGKFLGECYAPDLLNLLEPELREKITGHIQFGEEKIRFNGNLNQFSLIDKNYGSSVHLTIPKMTVSGVVLNQVSATIHAKDGKLSGEIHHAKINEHGSMKGTFHLDPGGITCTLSGKTVVMDMNHVFPLKVQNFINHHVSFSRKEEPVTFSGTFKMKHWDKKNLSGSLNLKYPHIKINGVEIRDIDTDLEFSSTIFSFRKFSTVIGNGSKFSGSVFFDLTKEHVMAEVICSGIPWDLAESLDKLWQMETLRDLAKDISSTVPGRIVECKLDFFADYGEQEFYRITGNVVMKDPSYCGVPFRYGAARFITDSNYKLAIPDLILESDEGTLRMRSLYSNVPNDPEGETLQFNIDSSISGNDLLKIFSPGWNIPLFDFPYPMHLTSSGVFNYTDMGKTKFRVDIQNGDCDFAGSRASNIDAVLHFKDWTLSFRKAEGAFCKGVFSADLNYNLKKESGAFKQSLENADLSVFMNEFNISDFAPTGTGNGKLSFVSAADFYYDKKKNDLLMMNGTGQLQLNGDDLWDIPVLSSFLKNIGDAWPVIGESTGITKLNCDIKFKDDAAVIQNVATNGNFVSLDADGSFFWNTGEYDLTFRAELLRNALPFEAMSKILTPVSWMLNKTVRGTYHFNLSQSKNKE